MREKKETNILYVNDNDEPIKFEGLDKKHVCLYTNWFLLYMHAYYICKHSYTLIQVIL